MKYKTPFIFKVKELVKKVLKPSKQGRAVYPIVQKLYNCWKTPIARVRLQKHGVDVIIRLQRVLDKHGVEYYFESGTMIGFVRDGGFIPNDIDIDVCLMPDTMRPTQLLRILIDEGYGFIHGFDYEGELMEFTIVDPTQITIDFFLPRTNPDLKGFVDYYVPFWSAKNVYPNERANNITKKTYVAATGIREIEVLGIRAKVALNAEEVLDSVYGPWRIPDPNYDPMKRKNYIVLPGFAYRVDLQQALSLKN